MLVNKRYISVAFNESRLRERNGVLSILLDMSNFLSTSMNLNDLLSGAIAKVLEYFDLEAGRIYCMDDKGQFLYLAAHHGMDLRGLEKMHIDEGFSGKAALTKSFIAQHVSELEDKKRAVLLLDKGLKIIICVPLINMDNVVGIMNLATSKMIRLENSKIDFLTTIGNQIAVAINNARLYEDLKNKIELLKEKKEMVKFFAYSVSHDLKSPAIGIYGLAKRIQTKYRDTLDEKGKAHCDEILKTSEHMVALVEKIDAYIAAKEVALHFEKIKVKEIIEIIRNEFSAILDQRQIRWSEPETMPAITADRMALSRVFRNFIDNALKYGGEELLEIKIGYDENEEFHIFWFKDDGVGINAGDKDRIFHIFQRNETSRGTAGSGLGLAIVKEIVEGHQGQVWTDHNTKKGTTFYFSISKNLKATD